MNGVDAPNLETPTLLKGRWTPILLLFTLVEKMLHLLELFLPEGLSRRLQGRRLSPGLPEDQLEDCGGEGDSDLLSHSQRRRGVEHGKREVVLAIETFTALQSKVVNIATTAAMVVAYGILITLVVLKYTLPNRGFYTSYSYNYASLCVAGVCITVLCIRGGIFAARIIANVRQGNHWPQRRLKVMSLVFASAVVQILNLVCWIAPNAYLASVPCKWNGWNSSVVNAFAILQWTCWNTLFSLIFLVQAHNLCAWTAPKAGSFTKQRSPLVMDAPWSIHWWKLLPWAVFEAVLIAWVATFPETSYNERALGCTGHSPVPQELLTCARTGPKWGGYIVCLSVVAYLIAFIAFMLVGFYQLHARPHRDLRMAVILFRLQSRTTFLAHKVVSISVLLLWLSDTCSAWSTAFVWWGIPPGQIVTTFLIWENCWYFMPSAADEDPVLQVYLQEFAWTEDGKSDALAQRAEHALHAAERSWLTKEPMFCFQTAIAMHRWSCLSYMDLESVQLPGIQETAQEAACSPGKGSLGQVSSDGLPTRNSQGLVKGAVAHAPSLAPSAGAAAPGGPSFAGFTSDGLGGPESRTSSFTTSTSYPASEADGSLGTRPSGDPVGSGQARRRAGKQKHAAKKQRASDQTRVALDAAMSLYGLTSFKLFWNPSTDTKALLAWNGETAVLAFRGTASLTNAWLDLKVWMHAHPPKRGRSWLGTCPKVHSGFYRSWTANGLHTEVMDYLQGLVDSGQLSAQARLLITGHSLGGALAVLAAFDIKRAMPEFRVQMYTYGTPYPGNRALAREFNELLPDTWHLIHDGDAVPRTGKFLVGKRPGQRVIVNQLGDMRVRPNVLELGMQGKRKVNPHYLDSYRTALQAAMVLQFTRRGTPRGRAGVLALGQNKAMRAIFAAEGLDWEAMQELHAEGKPLLMGRAARHARKASLGSDGEEHSWVQHLCCGRGASKEPDSSLGDEKVKAAGDGDGAAEGQLVSSPLGAKPA